MCCRCQRRGIKGEGKVVFSLRRDGSSAEAEMLCLFLPFPFRRPAFLGGDGRWALGSKYWRSANASDLSNAGNEKGQLKGRETGWNDTSEAERSRGGREKAALGEIRKERARKDRQASFRRRERPSLNSMSLHPAKPQPGLSFIRCRPISIRPIRYDDGPCLLRRRALFRLAIGSRLSWIRPRWCPG